MTPTQEFVRVVAMSLPPSDFGSNRAINAMAAAIDERYDDLLAALQSLLELHIAHHNALEHAAARKVIAKASGGAA